MSTLSQINLKTQLFSLDWPSVHTKTQCFRPRQQNFLKVLSRVDQFENASYAAGVLVWMAKKELFENADVKTVELPRVQVTCTFFEFKFSYNVLYITIIT